MGGRGFGFHVRPRRLFFSPQQVWHQNVGDQVSFCMFGKITQASFDKLIEQRDTVTGISAGDDLAPWTGEHALTNDPRVAMTVPTPHALLVCAKIRTFLAMPIPADKYPTVCFERDVFSEIVSSIIHVKHMYTYYSLGDRKH